MSVLCFIWQNKCISWTSLHITNLDQMLILSVSIVYSCSRWWWYCFHTFAVSTWETSWFRRGQLPSLDVWATLHSLIWTFLNVCICLNDLVGPVLSLTDCIVPARPLPKNGCAILHCKGQSSTWSRCTEKDSYVSCSVTGQPVSIDSVQTCRFSCDLSITCVSVMMILFPYIRGFHLRNLVVSKRAITFLGCLSQHT